MQIEIDRRALMRGLKAAQSAVQHLSTVPILSTVLVRANGALELMGTDLDLERRVSVPIAAGKGDGEYLIEDPRALLAVLKEASSATVELSAEPVACADRLTIKAGALVVRGSHEMHPDDFPLRHVTPHFLRATVGADFATAVRRLIPAISTEETRYYLNGVAIRRLGGARYRLAATDGHRLHIAEVELADAEGERWMGDAIIPRHAIVPMLEVIDATPDGARIEFGVSRGGNADSGLTDPAPKPDLPNAVHIGGSGDAVSCKLIDGTYPDVEKVFPQGCEVQINVKRADLRRAVAAARALARGRKAVAPVRIVATRHELTVGWRTPEGMESSMTVPADLVGAPFEVGFNSGYMIQALDVLGGDVVQMQWADTPVEPSGAGLPCKLTTPDDARFFAVLMPPRV